MLVAERLIHKEENFEKWEKELASETIAYDPRNSKWRCPLCKEKAIWVKKGSDGTVSHFRHKNAKSHPSISESEKHNLAKKKLKSNIEEDNEIQSVELEEIIGTYPDDYQIADIFLKKNNGKKIAVEIQCSNQKVKDFKERTRFYNKKDIAVLWILYKDNFLPKRTTPKTVHKDTVSFKESVKWVQRNWYGRCYILDDNLEIQAYRLERTPVNRTGKYGAEYTFYLKTVAEYSHRDLDNYGIFSTESNGFKIGRFYDKCWWK